MIPMRVAKQQYRDQPLGGTLGQVQAQQPDPGTRVNDDDLTVRGPYLHAGSVAANADGIRTRHWYGAPNAPENDLHCPPPVN